MMTTTTSTRLALGPLALGPLALGSLALAVALAGCGGHEPAIRTEPDLAAALGPLPATYTGLLPCADCPGIDYRLDLYPDGTFAARMTYREREVAPFDEIGAWALSSDGTVLVLHAGRPTPEFFAVVATNQLRKLDLEGRPIVSSLPYDLARAAAFAPLEPRLTLSGSYRYLADSRWLTECLTGRRLAVLEEEDNAALERAYLAVRPEPGAPVLATVEGRLVERPAPDDAGPQASLLVERFVSVAPDSACPPPFAPAPLAGTTWRLALLDDLALDVLAPDRRPTLDLDEQTGRVAAFGGCNRLVGAGTIAGDRLAFAPLAGTRMDCPPEAMDLERAYTLALERTARWRILGRWLELRDADGRRLARFEAQEP